MRWIAQGNPLSLIVDGRAIGPRAVLEREHEAQAPLVRRANRLAEQGREDDHRALALWMMHHCLVRDPALWELVPHGHLPRALPDRAQEVGELAPAVRAAFLWPRLREFARCLFADPERIDREDRDDRLRDEERIAEGVSLREKMLGYALCLAGWMAMDARRLPGSIIEHIGLSDAMTPADVRQALRDASWQVGPAGLALTVSCAHPAIDDAFRRSVDRAMAVLDRIHRGAAEHRARLEVLSDFPSRLTTEGIQARLDGEGRPVYQTPHVRFELAHDEVKELLMGEQLYGDPRLAIRELYQNALDACRYREARTTYLERKGGAQLEPWQGEIQFRQGENGGRAYIECEDNGVGMGLPELESCFAKAGRRFHDMPEFLEEQTEWLRVKPEVRLYPNSQFGIGVFSYFMLADEIEIETCRFHRDGSPGPLIRVHISGSGSLFRISVGGRGRRTGTCVRLYLGRTTYTQDGWREKPISCLELLDKILYIAEYHTSCTQPDGRLRVWEPGALSEAHSRGVVRLDDDLWVTSDGSELLLADGIEVQRPVSHLIVNLRRARRPRLSVDRKTVIDWDRQWIGETLRSQWSKLVDWSPDFSTLWWLESTYPDVAVRLTGALMQRGAVLWLPYGKSPVRLDEVGCCSGDDELFDWLVKDRDDERREMSEERFASEAASELLQLLPFSAEGSLAFAAQRLELWTRVGVRHPTDALEAARTDLQDQVARQQVTGTPCIPQAGDWLVLTRWDENPAGLVACAGRLRETVGQTAERLVKYAPFMVRAPILDAAAAAFVPVPEDAIFLSRHANGERPWLKGTPALFHMLDVARVLGRPVESVLAQYPRYRFVGIHAPEISREELEDVLPKDDADWLLLAGARERWDRPHIKQIPFMWLVQTAVKTGRPLGALLDRLRTFERVGLMSALLDFVPTADYQPEELDVRGLEQISDVSRSYTGMSIALGQLLATVMAGGGGHLLATARRLGLLPSACSDEVIAGLAIDLVDVSILSLNGSGQPPWIGRKMPRSHIAKLARQQNLDEPDLVRRVLRLTPLGVELLEDGEVQVL